MILSRRELLAAFAFFAVLAVLFTWPTAANITTEVPTAELEMDVLHLLFGVTWGTQALANQPFQYFQANFYHPYHSALSFMEHMFGIAIMAAPINWLFGNIVLGYNVAWLLTFALSGLGAFLLVRYVTESRSAALLAGILFAFFPFRYHNVGLINVLAVMWIPYALLSLHVWRESRERSQLLFFLAFALLQFLCSGYAGVFLLLSTVLYFLVLAILNFRGTLEMLSEERWPLISVAALGIMCALPFILPYLANAGEEIGFRRTLGETALYSAHPLDFVTPAPQSLLAAVTPWADRARHALFPGIVAIALTAFWLIRRGFHDPRHRPEYVFYTVLAAAGAILALGPVLGRIPLPFAVVFHAFPGGAFVRAPVRFATLFSLGISVLAAGGLMILANQLRSRRLGRAVVVVALGAALVELFAAPVAHFRPLPHGVPAVYQWLGMTSGDVAIAEYPMPATEQDETVDHARYMIYALHHKKPITNGVAAFVPPLTRELRTEMQAFPDRRAVAKLRALGVTYVFVHTEMLDPAKLPELRRAIEASPGLRWIGDEEGVWILDVVPGGN